MCDGQLSFQLRDIEELWAQLVTRPSCVWDSEYLLEWLAKDDLDLDREAYVPIFQNLVLRLDPLMLTELGFECFDRYFCNANVMQLKIMPGTRHLCALDLDGLDFLWAVALQHPVNTIALSAIDLIKYLFTHLDPSLKVFSPWRKEEREREEKRKGGAEA